VLGWGEVGRLRESWLEGPSGRVTGLACYCILGIINILSISGVEFCLSRDEVHTRVDLISE
jgi:hypothetical protein